MSDIITKKIESSILVVDDQPQNTEILAITLELEGYQVFTATSGEAALKVAREHKPNLMLLDILMPGMNGFDVCTELKANPDTADIPIIFVSALSDTNDRIKAFYAGGVDYIGKPFNLNEVVARVRTHMTLRLNQIENTVLREKLESQNERLGEIVNRRTKQLNHLNRRMVAILASITDAIILLHQDSTIDMTNIAFSSMLGYYQDELFAKPITRIIQPEYHDMIKSAFDAASQGDTQQHIQVQALRKDGSTIDVDLTFSIVNDEEGHILCNCHDITYLKEMERIKDNFVSMVTHELRTPVANIMLTANQFKRYLDRMTREQLERKIEQLDGQSRILAELIESVLDISRLQAQAVNLTESNEPVDMLDIVQGVVAELEHAAHEKQQTVEFIYDEQPDALYGDVVDLSRLWRNLISNAIKYTQNDGQISVRLGTIKIDMDMQPAVSPALLNTTFVDALDFVPGRYCVGQVEDNGHGISEEHQKQLFKRFHRGWAKESSIPGTGLGLALVKEQLTLYNGDIHFDSTLGLGTTFTFWIPFERNTTQADDTKQQAKT